MQIEQIDRDAAADIMFASDSPAWFDPDHHDYGLRIRIEIGQEDDHPTVQRLAAHRIAALSSRPDDSAVERVARAIEIAVVEKTAHHPARKLLAKMLWLWPHVARAAIAAMGSDMDNSP